MAEGHSMTATERAARTRESEPTDAALSVSALGGEGKSARAK